MTGLTGAVDAAIVNSGPVDKARGKENAQNLPFGMPGIIGNDMGANDYFVPQADTLVFQGRRNTEVHLIPDIGHCAVLGEPSKMGEVIERVVDWLPAQIGLASH